MINKKLNLKLNLNKSLSNLSNPDGGAPPFTPLDQTMKTPIEAPFGANHHGESQQGFYFAPPVTQASKQDTIYSNPHYSESDDILTDIDEPSFGSFKTTRNYTLSFTQSFDQLVLSVYSHFLSLPTTTPFSGITPPSGLVSKVANETMSKLIANTSLSNPPLYDHQSIINADYLRNHSYQPIFLQLIRKRLIDLCLFNSSSNSHSSNAINNSTNTNTAKLPESTTISVTSTGNGILNSSGAGLRQSSISNLSLNELNISNYNTNNATGNATRSRSSSLSLRKQSLTRNNSYTNNNWLHVGNINSIRPNGHPMPNGENFNISTDSLQSMQDYVPQSFINRSANNNISPNQSNFNSMMMDYTTPPNSNKGSVSGPTMTPPYSNGNVLQNNMQSGHNINDYEELIYYQQQFQQARSRSSSSTNPFPHPLTINTEVANTQAFGAMRDITTPGAAPSLRGNPNNLALDSPFMSGSALSEECGYFCEGFQQPSSNSTASPMTESPTGSNEPTLADSGRINLPGQFSLSEKKRDSLKMKRGIH
ncbi:DNA-binding proteins Bright/BRCAA1/RBP1 [Scheffersomyces xylosifermentans]|uniref:DNA-binding proteins Bright/BRCAA1/RBP1 n=1 Tax=Scheffersomyces xylosifermentans TaxID=1304137 RepID=UPI00315DB599